MKIHRSLMHMAFVTGAALLYAGDPVPWPAPVERGFHPGEVLRFHIKYELISAGKASMEIKEGPILGGRRTLVLVSNAESNSVIDKVFRVRDYNASTVDEDSLTSLAFHQNIREGGYKVVRTTTFDYPKGTFHFVKERKGNTTKRSGAIDRPVQDILSAFFYTRTLPLELGKEYKINVFSDPDIYPLKILVHSKLQKISVPAGKFECIRLEPQIIGDAIFKASEGKMTIWLTNDKRRMPVLIRSKVGVGAFDAELMDYHDPYPQQVARPD